MKKIAFLCTFLFASIANAAVINFGPTSATGSGPTINFNNIVTPTSITGDATVTLNVLGDLNSGHEHIDIFFDSLSLGRVFDNNTGNDIFNFANDRGNQSHTMLSGSATISESVFAALISDGFLNLTFDTSATVNCCGTIRHLSGSISWDSTAVSEPANIALFGLGLAMLGVARRRQAA